LSPAYDVTFAHNPNGEWTNQHLMSVNGKFKGFTMDDLLEVADRFAIGSTRKVIKQVQAAVASWPEFATSAGVPARQMEDIGAQHLRL
jgi:serine/threonine-protein kinase HipA